MDIGSALQTVLIPVGVSAVGGAFCLGVLHLRRLGRELRVKGVTARASVVRKLRKDGEGWLENFHAIVCFTDACRRNHEVEIRVDSRSWRSLREGGTTSITYLPDDPKTAAVGPVWGRKLVGALLLYISLVGAAVMVLGVGLPIWESLQNPNPSIPFAGAFAGALLVVGFTALLNLSLRKRERLRAKRPAQ